MQDAYEFMIVNCELDSFLEEHEDSLPESCDRYLDEVDCTEPDGIEAIILAEEFNRRIAKRFKQLGYSYSQEV